MSREIEWCGEFATFADWVNKARSWLALDYDLPDGTDNPVVCEDTAGNVLEIGKDFMAARDAGLFPVRYGWLLHDVPARYLIGKLASESARADAAESTAASWRREWEATARVLTETTEERDQLQAALDDVTGALRACLSFVGENDDDPADYRAAKLHAKGVFESVLSSPFPSASLSRRKRLEGIERKAESIAGTLEAIGAPVEIGDDPIDQLRVTEQMVRTAARRLREALSAPTGKV